VVDDVGKMVSVKVIKGVVYVVKVVDSAILIEEDLDVEDWE
jgi:hypothetical protein